MGMHARTLHMRALPSPAGCSQGLIPDSPHSEDDSKNICLHLISKAHGVMVLPCWDSSLLCSNIAIPGPLFKGIEIN